MGSEMCIRDSTKWVGGGLILDRDQRPIVARAVFSHRVDYFQSESSSSAARSSVNSFFFSKHFFPVFPIAAVREYLEPVSFLNSLEIKLCN